MCFIKLYQTLSMAFAVIESTQKINIGMLPFNCKRKKEIFQKFIVGEKTYFGIIWGNSEPVKLFQLNFGVFSEA